MFLRSAQQLFKLRRMTVLSQRLTIPRAELNHNYATLKSKKPLWPIQQYSTTTLNPVSQKANPNMEAETSRTSKHSLDSIMRRLDSFYRWNGFIGTEQFKPLLEIMKSGVEQVTPEQGLFLLNVCGCEMPSITAGERIENFQEVWQYLQDANMITKDHFLTMLNVLQYNRHPLKDYKTFLEQYENLQGSAKEVYSNLLATAGAAGNVKQATEILAEMRSLKLALSERDFNSLLLAHARANDMIGFQNVRDSMHATGLALSMDTQSTLFVAFMENGDEDKALNILDQYHGQFDTHQVLNMLHSLNDSPIAAQEFVVRLVKELKSEYAEGLEVPLALRKECVEFLHNK